MQLFLLNQGGEDDDDYGCSPTLDVGCQYNDQEILRLSVFIGMDVPCIATLMQCRKLKFGMQFLHVRIYQPLAKWVRYSTINMRDFCRRLGLTGLQEIVEIGHVTFRKPAAPEECVPQGTPRNLPFPFLRLPFPSQGTPTGRILSPLPTFCFFQLFSR